MLPDALTSLAAYVVALGSGAVGWAGSVEKRLRGHDDRIDDVERRQEGDAADPTNQGILQTVQDLGDEVEGLERDVEQVDAKLEKARTERQQEHGRVMDRLDQLEEKIDA